MQGTMPGARRRGRLRTAWMDNNKTWTRLSVEESIRMREDRDEWRKYVHGVANPWTEDGERTEQNWRVGGEAQRAESGVEVWGRQSAPSPPATGHGGTLGNAGSSNSGVLDGVPNA